MGNKKNWLSTRYATIEVENIRMLQVSKTGLFFKKYGVYAVEKKITKTEAGAWYNVLLDEFNTFEEASDYIQEVSRDLFLRVGDTDG